jgi:hypothetical protein
VLSSCSTRRCRQRKPWRACQTGGWMENESRESSTTS